MLPVIVSETRDGPGLDKVATYCMYTTVWIYKVNPRKGLEVCRCWSSPPSNSKFSCIPTHHRIPIWPLANNQPSPYLPARSSWIQPGSSLDTLLFIGSMEFHTEPLTIIMGEKGVGYIREGIMEIDSTHSDESFTRDIFGRMSPSRE